MTSIICQTIKCQVQCVYRDFLRIKYTRLKMSEEMKFPLKLCVSGFEDRKNDVLYSPPLSREGESIGRSAIVYFGGDIQDFGENMKTHRDNKNYLKWSLEGTTEILRSSFPDSHVIVIRPVRMEYKTFSCYDNFVPCGNCGVPEHTPMHHSLRHLELLLKNVSDEVPHDLQIIPIDCTTNLKLIGFSKGCVVLNQFLYEFHYLKNLTLDPPMIVSRIKEMYWLDGGHSGGKNTWITSKSLLETFSVLGIKTFIHVSPYQIEDDRRPWIKKEEKSFYNTLCSFRAPVERTVHYQNVDASIINHFSILNDFRKIVK